MDLSFLHDLFSDTDNSGMESSVADHSAFDHSIIHMQNDSIHTYDAEVNDHDYTLLDGGTVGFDDWYLGMHGTPVEDAASWHEQTTDFTCGVVSAEMIMEMHGINLSEAQLVYEATEAGYLTDHGIGTDGIRYLLELHGISTHLASGSIEDLTNALDQGHKIIVPVDSGEIWHQDSPFEDFFKQQADHAVVVTGIDYEGDKSYVILNDPGQPEGQAFRVEMQLFMDAWKDSGNIYIETDSKIS